jgi:hypothetical protein
MEREVEGGGGARAGRGRGGERREARPGEKDRDIFGFHNNLP